MKLRDEFYNMKQSNKYHKILSLYKRDKKDFSFIIGEWKTPELAFLKDLDWIWTEKIDGMNIRIMWNGKDVRFGGRSDDTKFYTPLLLKLQQMFMVGEKLEIFKDNFGTDEMDVVLYGEGYGAKIQKGGERYIPDDVSFVLFDVAVDGLYLIYPF